jgi:hypothetical protein
MPRVQLGFPPVKAKRWPSPYFELAVATMGAVRRRDVSLESAGKRQNDPPTSTPQAPIDDPASAEGESQKLGWYSSQPQVTPAAAARM